MQDPTIRLMEIADMEQPMSAVISSNRLSVDEIIAECEKIAALIGPQAAVRIEVGRMAFRRMQVWVFPGNDLGAAYADVDSFSEAWTVGRKLAEDIVRRRDGAAWLGNCEYESWFNDAEVV